MKKEKGLIKLIAAWKLAASASELLRWLYAKGSGLVEVNLADFQKLIERCRRTVKRSLEKLVACGAIQVIKDYQAKGGEHWLRLWLPEISSFFCKKECHATAMNVQKNSPKPQCVESDGLAAATTAIGIKTKEYKAICEEEAGITFTDDGITNLLGYQEHEIRCAIKLFKKRGGLGSIENPQGWLVSCLQRGFWREHYSSKSTKHTVIENVINPIKGEKLTQEEADGVRGSDEGFIREDNFNFSIAAVLVEQAQILDFVEKGWHKNM